MKTEDARLKGYENSPYRGKTGEMNIEFPNFRQVLDFSDKTTECKIAP